jgi:hypothetical protein
MRSYPSYSILPFLRYLDIDQIDGFAYSFVPTDIARPHDPGVFGTVSLPQACRTGRVASGNF